MIVDPASLELKNLQRALLVGVYSNSSQKSLCEDYLRELERLCETYGWRAVGTFPCMLRKIDAATYLSKGKVEQLVQMVIDLHVDVVVFDDEISPHQQRNLERLLKKAVIDRTELIIEVFAQRAQTREARLQIELAKTRYQMPRLKRLWTHLSRQSAGGGAYLKGEGEKQLEIDKRILRRQIDSLKQEIDQVVKQRHTQRSLRVRTQIPTFAIVGYTNVGKSTLLKALTQSDVFVEDKLFATLDTTTRKFILPNKQSILLIDTVGFIRKIPHTLVAAFRSTLEEAIHTDILLHLIDMSHPMAFSQAEETLAVLKELGVEGKPIITVLNKIDLCSDHSLFTKFRILYQKTVPISAETGEGFELLLDSMMHEIALLRRTVRVKIPQSHYALVSELMSLGRVLECEYEENDVVMKLEVPASLEHRIKPFLFG